MKQFNHAFTVAFEIETDAEDVENIPAQDLRQAMIDRANALYSNNEFVEALGAPFDTYDNFEGHPVEDWQEAVAADETTLGYHDWAAKKAKGEN